MDFQSKILKALYEIIVNQERIRRQNNAIIRELRVTRSILEQVHGIHPHVKVEEGEND